MPKWSRDYLLASILAAVAVFLALLLALEWAVLTRSADGNSGPRSARTAPAQNDGMGAKEGFELPGIDEYAETAAHPLFMENRLPGAELAETAAAPPPPTPMNLKLMGVVRTPGDATALIMDSKGKYKRVKLNDPPVDGWTLVELGQDQATMQQGERREPLRLLKPRKPSGPVPAVPAQPIPGQVRPGQPMPGQPFPAQPIPGQPRYPNQGIPVTPPNAVAGDDEQDIPEDDPEAVDEDTGMETDSDEN